MDDGKDRAILSPDTRGLGTTSYVLDGKDMPNLIKAVKYLKNAGFSSIEAIDYLNGLRVQAARNQSLWTAVKH
jgi:hypothetical protein